LVQKKGNLIRGDEEDEEAAAASANKRIQKQSRTKVIQEFQEAIVVMNKPGATITAVEEKEEQVKTLKEVLEEREE
jgi:16S rRNA U516 pseudouridylate synthase RsuA-like enzyme